MSWRQSTELADAVERVVDHVQLNRTGVDGLAAVYTGNDWSLQLAMRCVRLATVSPTRDAAVNAIISEVRVAYSAELTASAGVIELLLGRLATATGQDEDEILRDVVDSSARTQLGGA